MDVGHFHCGTYLEVSPSNFMSIWSLYPLLDMLVHTEDIYGCYGLLFNY